MNTKLTILAVLTLLLAAVVLVGCGKKSQQPPSGPAIAPPEAGPAGETGGPAAGPETSGPAAGPETEAPAPEGESEQTPEAAPGEPGAKVGESSGKPPKAKLSDDQFVELMGDLAVTLKKVSDKKMDREQATAELEKTLKQYGLTMEEFEKEQQAHQTGTPEQQQALGLRVLKRMEERLQEAEGKKGK